MKLVSFQADYPECLCIKTKVYLLLLPDITAVCLDFQNLTWMQIQNVTQTRVNGCMVNVIGEEADTPVFSVKTYLQQVKHV